LQSSTAEESDLMLHVSQLVFAKNLPAWKTPLRYVASPSGIDDGWPKIQ
jgi:hypothetical protein